jgi:hypothetical protein
MGRRPVPRATDLPPPQRIFSKKVGPDTINVDDDPSKGPRHRFTVTRDRVRIQGSCSRKPLVETLAVCGRLESVMDIIYVKLPAGTFTPLSQRNRQK